MCTEQYTELVRDRNDGSNIWLTGDALFNTCRLHETLKSLYISFYLFVWVLNKAKTLTEPRY